MTARSVWFVSAVLAASSGCVGGSSADGGVTGDGGARSDGGVTVVGHPDAVPPQLVMVQAQVSGRTGRDVHFTVKAKDRNLDVVGLWVRLLDASGSPVVGLDSDRDGVADAAEGAVSLDAPKWVGEAVSGSATLRGTAALAPLATQVGVVIQDATNLRSMETVIPIVQQPVRAPGEACDVTAAADRCTAGQGCRGMPATCQEGVAPQVTRLGFYRAAGGPTIILEGTEPEDDLLTVRIEFQNAQGQAISVDSDGDGTPDLAFFDVAASTAAVDGTFFLRMQAGDGLDAQVGKLVATATDAAGHTGAPKIVAPSAVPTRSSGQTCDPRGFDVCGPMLACSPGTPGATNTCSSAASLRATQCRAMPVLIATAEGATVIGRAEGGSLWDAPAGCSTNDPKGRPEGMVTLRLMSRADSVTLSTVHAGTNFDTTMYVLTGCPADSSASLGCNDDLPQSSGASQLVLTDMPAGDYLVVIDSFDTSGGAFELSATVQ